MVAEPAAKSVTRKRITVFVTARIALGGGVGALVGDQVPTMGAAVGTEEGARVGDMVGCADGATVGKYEGAVVGMIVGEGVCGAAVG